MGMGGGSSKPSFTFNDKQALALNQQNSQQLQKYQLQRQKAVSQGNAQTAQYFQDTNALAQDSLLKNMSMYTNALSGYQNSLNQNTSDAQSLMNQQQQYYNTVLNGQQQYQNQFAGLLGQYNQQAAADNAAYQQQYLQQLGQYNQDNTAQQQQFMQAYLGQMGDYAAQNQEQQQRYQEAFRNTRRDFQQMKVDTSANQAAIQQQSSQQGLMNFLQQWASNNPQYQNMMRNSMPGVGLEANGMLRNAAAQYQGGQPTNVNNKVQRRR